MTDPRLDMLEIFVGNERRVVQVDYWRIGPRTAAPVWLFKDANGRDCVVTVHAEHDNEVEQLLADLVTGRRSVTLAERRIGPSVVGLIIGMEQGPAM